MAILLKCRCNLYYTTVKAYGHIPRHQPNPYIKKVPDIVGLILLSILGHPQFLVFSRQV